MDFGVKGRVAIVLASSDGLGLACAEALGREGAHVLLCSRDRSRLQTAKGRIERASGALVETVAADIHNAEERRRIVNAAISAFGKVHILIVNTPGGQQGFHFSGFKPLAGYQPADWTAAIQAKLYTALDFAELVVPHMRSHKWGRIVNLSTITALEPIAQFGLSNTTRVAALGLFRTLALEVGTDGITVNSVLVGHARTKTLDSYFEQLAAARGVDRATVELEHIARTAIRRLLQPEEIGAFVAFLCSEAGGAITGQSVRVDGGFASSL